MPRSALTVDVNTKEVQKALRAVSQRLADKAIPRALNRTIVGVRTEANKLVRAQLNLKAADVNKRMSVVRARPADHVASLTIAAKAQPLYGYGARDVRPRGVSVKVKRQGARKRVKRAFVAKMKSGHVGVFMRRGKSRLPIDELFSVSVVHWLRREEALAQLGRTASERFTRELAAQLKFITKG